MVKTLCCRGKRSFSHTNWLIFGWGKAAISIWLVSRLFCYPRGWERGQKKRQKAPIVVTFLEALNKKVLGRQVYNFLICVQSGNED